HTGGLTEIGCNSKKALSVGGTKPVKKTNNGDIARTARITIKYLRTTNFPIRRTGRSIQRVQRTREKMKPKYRSLELGGSRSVANVPINQTTGSSNTNQ